MCRPVLLTPRVPLADEEPAGGNSGRPHPKDGQREGRGAQHPPLLGLWGLVIELQASAGNTLRVPTEIRYGLQQPLLLWFWRFKFGKDPSPGYIPTKP